MPEDEIVNVDTSNDTEETVEINLDETTEESEVDVEKLQATNKKLFERAKKAEADLKALRKPEPAKEQKTDDVDSLIENISILKNMDDDEISDLKSEAKSLGVPIVSYIKSKSGQIHLKEIRREKKSKEASVAIGSSSPVFKKHTMEDLSKMSSEELAKVLPHAG